MVTDTTTNTPFVYDKSEKIEITSLPLREDPEIDSNLNSISKPYPKSYMDQQPTYQIDGRRNAVSSQNNI